MVVLIILEEYSELSILFRSGFFSPNREEVEGEDAEEQQPQQIDSYPAFTQPISAAALKMSDQILNSIKFSTELERNTPIRSEKRLPTHRIVLVMRIMKMK